MADSVRIRRIAEQIRNELSEILRDEVQDPRIGMLTITRVKLASDLGAATIFYSPLGEDPDAKRKLELERSMRRVSSFVRRALSRRVELRHTPELRFILDDSIAEGSHTLELIRSLEISKEEEGVAPEGDDAGAMGNDGETERET